ncbi:MAG: hypothetical protein M1826_006481 [Phylliscum demangeonii]|nr:MAG: hypothetical protein M1826_006481 [Phylliscum demangeonii]
MQACIHLFYDYDRVSLPATATHAGLLAKGASIAPPAPHEQLMTELPSRVQAAFFRSLSMAVVGPLVYSFFLRRITWRWTMVFAERVWTLPRASSVPPSTPPYQFSLLARSVLAGFLLVLLWEISAISLGVYVAQEPLKRGRPLTDYSKDPNGTLITGLRSKREIPRSFAYWELFLIAERFPARRKTFFEEIDRRGGATWSQLMNACSGVIQSLNSRMVEAMMPPAPSAQQPPPQQGIVQALPRISPPLNEDPIFQGPPPPVTRRDHVQSRMGAFARSHGQYPITAQQGWTPIDLLQWLFHQAVDRLITPEQKQALSQSQLSARVNEYALAFLRSPLGAPFQQTLSRRSAAVVLGSPRGDLGVLLDAIDALSLLATDSMAEDPYGKVQADIAALVNMYTVTIQNLTVFQTQFPPHWTDVEADQRRQRRERRRLRQPLPLPHAPVPDPDSDFAEVDVLLRALKGGLARMLDAFGAYAGSLGLSGNEMRLAREMAGVAITGKDGDGKGGEGGPGGRPTGRIGLT